MKEIKLKHILIAALIPVLVLSLGMSIKESIRFQELNLIGIVVGMYYAIPSVLFSLGLVSLLRVSNKLGLNFISMSLIGQLVLSLVFVLMFLTLWVWYDGGTYHYFGKGFFAHWAQELKRYWMVVLYFGLTVPILLRLFMKRRAKN